MFRATFKEKSKASAFYPSIRILTSLAESLKSLLVILRHVFSILLHKKLIIFLSIFLSYGEMLWRRISFFILSLILILSTTLSFKPVQAAWTGGTITIRADGSVDPPNAPLVKGDKMTYYLTDDVIVNTGDSGIVVERDNVVIDGNKHSITGIGKEYGIKLKNRVKVTIRNIIVKDFKLGIYLESSSENEIAYNTLLDNEYCGIYLNSSSSNTIVNNIVFNNWYSGIHLYYSDNNTIAYNVFINCGLLVFNSYSNTVENNTVNGKPLVYLENARDLTVKDAGQVILVRCERIRVENLNLLSTTVGVELWESNNNIITNNTISNNLVGISLSFSLNNTITGNTILYSKYCGIFLLFSNGSSIYHNNFLYNIRQVYSYNSVNIWDDGYPSGGNYWSDNGESDANKDGIWDTPYIIDSENVDRYPLVKQYVIYEVKVSSPYGDVIGSGRYAEGSTVTISISKTVIDYDNGTKRVFDGWYEDNSLISREQSFSITVGRPRKIVANWHTEYRVEVLSERGVAMGSGWYKAGSTVTVSLTQTRFDGFFNYYIFEGWKIDGNIVSNSPTYSLTVDKPVTLVASWRTGIKPFTIGLVIGIIVILIIIIIALILRKRKQPSKVI